MISKKHKDYAENRNSLRYLITDPFKEPFGVSLLNIFKAENMFIVNKIERIDEENTRITVQLRKNNKDFFIKVNISKDHLIKLEANCLGTLQEKTTRVIEEALLFVTCFLKE